MKKIGLGLLVGFVIAAWFFRQPEKAPLEIEVGHETRPQIANITPVLLPHVYSVKGLDQSVRKVAAATVVPVATPSSLSLNLELENIREMEEHSDELVRNAYATEEQEGWRIHLMQNERILSKTGLHDGDLIPFESLSAQLATPDQGPLAARFQIILNHIKR